MALRKLAALKESGEYRSAEDGNGNGSANADPEAKANTNTDTNPNSEMDKMANENAYLRKQVKSEIQCKKELSKALDSQCSRLKAARASVAELELERRQWQQWQGVETPAVVSEETSSGASKSLALAAENLALTTALSEARECYAASRSNLSVTQRALESSREVVEELRLSSALTSTKLSAALEAAQGKEKERRDVAELYNAQLAEAEVAVRALRESKQHGAALTDEAGRRRLAATKLGLAVVELKASRAEHIYNKRPRLAMDRAFAKWAGGCRAATVAAQARAEASEAKAGAEVAFAKCEAERKEALKEALALKKTLKSSGQKLSAASAKLETAFADASLLKKRVLALQGELRSEKSGKKAAVDALQEKAVESAAKVDLLFSKLEEAEALRVRTAADSVAEREGALGRAETGMERELLALERRLREEFAVEDRQGRREREKEREKGEEVRAQLSDASQRINAMETTIEDMEVNFEKEKAKEKEKEKAREKEEKKEKAEKDNQSNDMSKEKQALEATILQLKEQQKEQLSEQQAAAALEAEVALARVKKESIGQLRKSVGEERARACRQMQRARDDFDEKLRARAKELRVVTEAAKEASDKSTTVWREKMKAVVDKVKTQLAEAEKEVEKRVEESSGALTERLTDTLTETLTETLTKTLTKTLTEQLTNNPPEKLLEHFTNEKRAALLAEVQKWERTVKDMEETRIEEITSLQETERSASEESRRLVTKAAKKAIEEARGRYKEVREELESFKSKAVGVKRADEEKILRLEKAKQKAQEEAREKAQQAEEQQQQQMEQGRKTHKAHKALQMTLEAGQSKLAKVEKVREEVEELNEIYGKKIEELEGKLGKVSMDVEGERGAWRKEREGWTLRGVEWSQTEKKMGRQLELVEEELEEFREKGRTKLEENTKLEAKMEAKKVEDVERIRVEGLKVMEEEIRKVKEQVVREEHRVCQDKVESIAKELVAERGRGEELREKNRVRHRVELDMARKESRRESDRGREEASNMAKNLRDNLEQMVARYEKLEGGVRRLVGGEGGGGREGGGEERGKGKEKEKEKEELSMLEEKLKTLDEEQRGEERRIAEQTVKIKGVELLARESDQAVKLHNSAKDGALSPGGSLSIAFVKKGRRLNEELESNLGMVQSSRKKLGGMKGSLTDCLEKKAEIVGQQRRIEQKMLSENKAVMTQLGELLLLL